MKHKILIGFMGSGKSAVSAALADLLGWKLLDTDAQIEKEQEMTISEIFRAQGEGAFRNMETALLNRLAGVEEPLVISAGGGLGAQPQNRETLKQMGDVIWLRVRPETVLKRLEGDMSRPLLQGPYKEQKVRDLLDERAPLYGAAASFQVDTDGKTPLQIAEEIIKLTEGGRI